ncbi:hypothetical protein [Oceaniovalibus sp. ACAM 378]|uniref:hypothetical protein n=1 Tax=Oceaniovalibus sp. ACAM 378 TaxID=2599923 RepID=UPI0011DA783D|nr:hypothetical protein [Oceaniovalibus sp. ACAM 378]TYB85213.1 hypothetical protein FQ320_19940 [Oceaniovalibus sp. ACAM 378]
MKKKSALALIECEKIDSMSSSTDKGADQSDRFHHAPDLGDVPSDGLIGNTPLLMAFQYFASGGEDNVDVYTSWGDKHIHIRIESRSTRMHSCQKSALAKRWSQDFGPVAKL